MLLTYNVHVLFIFFILTKTTECSNNNACKTFEAYQNIDSNPDCYYVSDIDDELFEIVLKYVGVCEVHEVTTEDGYILTLFRIPQKNPKEILLFQHGILLDARSWVSQFNDSIAFLFWRSGHEVWLGNSRGNRYSKKHITLSPDDGKFWNFSFHEMGYYDLSATIDFIKMTTNRSKIIYLGYSMGASLGLVYSSLRPRDAEESIKLMITLGPVSIVNHTNTPLIPMFYFTTLFMKYKIYRVIKWHSLAKYDGIILRTFRYINHLLPYKKVFLFAMCVLTGWTHSTDPNYINMILNKFGSETSLKNVAHFRQMVGNDFQMYDYGKEDNLQIYGAEKPPLYPLKDISVPIFTFYSADDIVSHPDDVELLYTKLPDSVKTYGKVKLDGMNHYDFLFGLDRNERIYNVIINTLDII